MYLERYLACGAIVLRRFLGKRGTGSPRRRFPACLLPARSCPGQQVIQGLCLPQNVCR
jgi:hypothetical protein